LNRFRSIVLAAAVAGLMCASAASAQTISVVSGNGQVLTLSSFTLQPLVVRVTDGSGNPVPNTTVTWVASGSLAAFTFFFDSNTATRVTDSDGIATAFGNISASLTPGASFISAIVQTNVSASISSGSSVNFTVTQIPPAPNSSVLPTIQATIDNSAFIQQPTFSGEIFAGAQGEKSSKVIQIHLAAYNGLATSAIPNAAIQLLNLQDPNTGPAVACLSTDPNAGFGTVLTDANGNATCTPVFGGQPCSSPTANSCGQFVVAYGGLALPLVSVTPAGFWQVSPNDENNPTPILAYHLPTAGALNLKVTPGATGNIKKTQGDNQSVNPGAVVPTLLQVEVDDNAGKPLSGRPVNWTVSPPNAANLTSTSGFTDFNGKASPGVIVLSGNATGTVLVRATLGTDSSKSVTFTINAITPAQVTAFDIVSGNNQSAAVNTSFSQPLVVQVTTSAGTPSGVIVQFSATGPVFVSATVATTDSNGRAQINVLAGSGTGSASVTATVAGATPRTFSLSVTPPAPIISTTNFLNGADLQPNSLSPCALGAVVTSPGALGIASVGPTFPGLPVPSSTVKLTINNVGAPILSVGINPAGQQQIEFQTPCESPTGGAVPAVLTVGTGSSNVNLAIGAASPGIFSTQMSDGAFRAVVTRPDGSYVSLSNPARRGEQVVAFVTGLGATTPSVGTQALPQPGTTAVVQGTVIVGMAGRAVPFSYARLSEDLPGVYVVGFQIPADMTTGNDVSFSITVQVSGTPYNSGSSRIPVQ
jgi:uncharacterized protein (TIGR03437 family)